MMKAMMIRILGLAAIFTAAFAQPTLAQVTLAEGSANIFVPTIARNSVNEAMLQMTIKNGVASPASEVIAATITASGTGNDVADLIPAGVSLYWDKNNDGRLNTGGGNEDVLLGVASSYGADNGTVTFSGFSLPLDPGAQVNVIVVYSLGASATNGKSFQAKLASNAALSVRRTDTQAAVTVSGAPVNGFTRAVGAGTLTVTRNTQNPDGATAIPNRKLVPLISITVAANDVEAINLASLDFADSGSADLSTTILPGTVRLFLTATNSAPTNAALALATGSFSADGGRVTLTPVLPLNLPRAGSAILWVTADMAAETAGVIGTQLQIQVPAANPFSAAGIVSTDAPAVIGAPANGPPWQFNYNPVAFGLTSGSDAGAVLMPSNAQNYPVAAFQIKNDTIARSEAASITTLTFHADGTMNEATAITAVKLYKDTSPIGRVNASDVLLGTGLYSGDNGTLTINFSAAVPLPVSGQADLLLAYDLNGSAVNGQTARASVLTRDDFSIVGQVSLVNAGFSNPPFRSAIKTVGNPRGTLTFDTTEKNVGSVLPPGSPDVPLLAFRVTAGNDEDLKLTALNLLFTGPLDETGFFDRIALYADTSGDSVITAGEPLLVEGNLTALNGDGLLHLDIPVEQQLTIARTQYKAFVLMGDTKTSLIGDGTEVFNITASADTDFLLEGALSGAVGDYTSVAPPISYARTIRNPAISVGTYSGLPQDRNGCINGGYGMMGLRFNTASGEDLIIKKIRFSVSGTLNDPQFTVGAYTWNDQNYDFLIDTSEPGLAYGFHTASNPITVDNGSGEIDFSSAPGTIERAKNNVSISTGLDFQALDAPTAIAQIGKTVTMFQIGNAVIEGVGARSGRPIEVTNPVGSDQGRTITFDKGTLDVASYTVPRVAGPPNGSNIEVLGLYLKTDFLEPVRINSLTLTPFGTLDESKYIKPGGIKIYMEPSPNGKIDTPTTTDVLIAQLDPPAFDNGPLVITPDKFVQQGANVIYSHPLIGQPDDHWLVTVDLKPDAPEGMNLGFQLAEVTDISATGACSLYPYALGSEITFSAGLPPIDGPVVTVERGTLNIATDSAFAGDADNQPNVVMAPAASGYEVARMTVKANDSEDIQLAGFTFVGSGSANEALDLDATFGVQVYLGSISDSNLLAQGGFLVDNGALNLTFETPLQLKRNEQKTFYVVFNGTGAGQIGSEIDLSVAGSGLQASGVTSLLPITGITPDDPYLAIPIRFGAGTLRVIADEADDFLLPLAVVGGSKLQRVTFAATRTEKIVVDSLTVHAAGTANEPAVLENAAVILNYRTSPAAQPTPIASAPITVDNGDVTLRNLNIQVVADSNTAQRHSIDGVLKTNGVPTGSTLRFNIDNKTKIEATGALTGLPPTIKLDDTAGGDNLLDADTITGRKITVSTGLVTLTKGSKNPANANIVGNEPNLPLMQITGKVEQKLEAVTVSEVDFCYAGQQDPSVVIGNLRLYNDVNNDGIASANDVLLGTAQYVNEAGTFKARFTGLALTYPTNATFNWLLVGDLTGQLQQGGTVQASFCTPSAVGTGQITQQPLNPVLGNPAPVGAIYTLPVTTPTPSPTAGSTATPSPTPTRTPTPTPTRTPSPTPSPVTPTATGTPTGSRAVADYDNSGCTDLADFLFLLDYWTLTPPGFDSPLLLADFLNLLDNWTLGPICPQGLILKTPEPRLP